MKLAVGVSPGVNKSPFLPLRDVFIKERNVEAEGEREVRWAIEHAVDHSVQQSGQWGNEGGRRAQWIRHRAFKMEIPVASGEEDDGRRLSLLRVMMRRRRRRC